MEATTEELYLDLLKHVLTRHGFGDVERQPVQGSTPARQRIVHPLQRFLRARKLELVRFWPADQDARYEGRIWPVGAETMVGIPRLDNFRYCIESAIDEMIPGDIIEAGVWRGGASIYARAVLAAHGVTDRAVWVADSFQGLPPPEWEQDEGDTLYLRSDVLGVSLEAVKANFARYGLLDDQVRFLEGWFADTLPRAPIERLAVLRLDGDMYKSTLDSLDALYHKVQPGGYVIVDDYYGYASCAKAIDVFRDTHKISDPLLQVDWTCVYWRKT